MIFRQLAPIRYFYAPEFESVASLSHKLLIGLLFLGLMEGRAQPSLEAGNWFFGDRAGITFLTRPPSPLMAGQTHLHNYGPYPQRGVSTISDRNGQLICYTNGEMLFNRHHGTAVNGGNIGGHGFASQTLILPQPGNRSLYYIFTTDSWMRNYGNGLRYSIYNACSDSVISKNNPLLANAAENVAAIQHANGTDYWIVSYTRNTDSFYTFRLSDLGLTAGPTGQSGFSAAPTSQPKRGKMGQGELKISPNGTYLAMAHTAVPDTLYATLVVCRFDRNTGAVSNCIQLPTDGAEWSLAFSMDESRLFVGQLAGRIVSYTLSPTLDSATIQNSRTIVVDTPTGIIGGLQLGIDSNIYVTRGFYLGRISPLTGYAFQDSFINLQGRYARYSLPNLPAGFRYFPKAWFHTPYIELADSTVCAGSESAVAFYPEGEGGWHYYWDFGDGSPIYHTLNDSGKATHIYNQPGQYAVQLVVDDGCFIDTADTATVTVVGISAVLPIDTMFCLNTTAEVPLHTEGTDSAVSVSWFLNDTLQCIDCDTFRFFVADSAGGEVKLQVVSSEGCITTDSFSFLISAPPPPDFTILNVPCEGDTAFFYNQTDTSRFVMFEWHFADFQDGQDYTYHATYIYDHAGHYDPFLVSIDSFGCRDTVSRPIRVKHQPKFSAGADMKLCAGQAATLGFGADSLIARYNFLWTPSDYLSCYRCPHPIATPRDSITYTLTVIDTNGCQASSSVRLLIPYYEDKAFFPNAFTPNDDRRNDRLFLVGTCIRRSYLAVYSRWGDLLYETDDPRRPWDGSIPGRGGKIGEGVYLYDLFIEFYSGRRERHRSTLQVLY